MRNIALVAQREYIAHVRTKGFVIGIVFTPLLIVGFWGISKLVDRLSEREGKPFVVVDASTPAPDPQGRFGSAPPGHDLGRRLAVRWLPAERWALERVVRVGEDGRDEATLVDELSASARAGELAGFAVLRGDLVAGDGRMQWYTRNVANEDLKNRVESVLRDLVSQDRFEWYGVSEEQLAAIRAPVIDPTDVDVSGRTSGDSGAREAGQLIPMIFVYALMVAISSQMQTLLTSTIDEKTNRIAEVLLSSISPFEMMTGKILGVLGANFTLMAVWCVGAAYLVFWRGWQHLIPVDVFAWFLAYMVLAILFYSTVIAAVGSAVTEMQEAQSLMLPVWIALMLPLFLMYFVSTNPDALWVRVITYFPLVTPFLMVNRLASVVPPGPIEIAASILLIVVSTAGAMWLAARIFRIAILLYGKPATPRELWRWMRTG